MLWFIISILIIIAIIIVITPLLRTVQDQAENRYEQNILIAKEQLLELKQAKSQGLISDADYVLAHDDLEQTLHSDLAVKDNTRTSELAKSYKMTLALIVLLPLSVISLYTFLGSPSIVKMLVEQEEHSLSPRVAAQENSQKVAGVGSLFKQLKQRLEQNPDDIDGWKMMGLTYMHFEQYQQAVDAYKMAVSLSADDVDAQQGLSRALALLSTPAESDIIEKKMIAPNGQTIDVGAMVMRLRSKLEQNPDNIQGWLMLGRSYSNLGKKDEAINAYQMALALEPNNAEIAALLKTLEVE